MSTIAMHHGMSLSQLATRLAPRRTKVDPLGIVSGYRAYVIYTRLSSLSDEELADLGLTRDDLPRAAMEAVRPAA